MPVCHLHEMTSAVGCVRQLGVLRSKEPKNLFPLFTLNRNHHHDDTMTIAQFFCPRVSSQKEEEEYIKENEFFIPLTQTVIWNWKLKKARHSWKRGMNTEELFTHNRSQTRNSSTGDDWTNYVNSQKHASMNTDLISLRNRERKKNLNLICGRSPPQRI